MLCWVGLGWVGLGWVGLGWVGYCVCVPPPFVVLAVPVLCVCVCLWVCLLGICWFRFPTLSVWFFCDFHAYECLCARVDPAILSLGNSCHITTFVTPHSLCYSEFEQPLRTRGQHLCISPLPAFTSIYG